MERLLNLYESRFGARPDSVLKIADGGSSRRYFRMSDMSRSVIGTIGDDICENRAFFQLDSFFIENNLPVPKVLAVSDDCSCYIQEDAGDVSACDVILREGPQSDESLWLVARCMEMLARFHGCGVKTFDTGHCYPRQAMDSRSVMWDLNYFKYCFLKLAGVEIDEERLERELQSLCDSVAVERSQVLILRDFQSRNVMVADGHLKTIDFQGARMGNPLYDVASFLWQTRINLAESDKWNLAAHYVRHALQAGVGLPLRWERSLIEMAQFRMLQVLGAYGFRGLHEHKAKFVTEIHKALSSAVALMEKAGDGRLPYLESVLRRLMADGRFKPADTGGRLKVTVCSFSYKRGIPEDFTGNGGGFVFDCRAVHNPGRYEEYKKLTGMDREVIDFLEKDGEILSFMDNCYGLVDPSVGRYIKRGFTCLTVSFGCTGGQHRSVYGAEAMARHIAANFDCDVTLIHREQGVERIVQGK